MRFLLLNQTKTLRTASLRVLRYYCKEQDFLAELLKLKVHYFITKYERSFKRTLHFISDPIRSLEQDKQGEAERLQALKLVRRMMEINCSLLPFNIIHCLVSIAEHEQDSFCRAAVEALCEISKFYSCLITSF